VATSASRHARIFVMTLGIERELQAGYENYYGDANLDLKRKISAEMSKDHVMSLVGRGPFSKVVDIGAGQGSLVELLAESKFADSITALEISTTGVDAISRKRLPTVNILRFDGYTMPGGDKEFDLALCMHVLEHVEHERAFLREIKRIAKRLVIEVPLDLTAGLARKLPLCRAQGHINLYTAATFRNILTTSGLSVARLVVQDTSLAYEKHMHPRSGSLRHALRKSLLATAPSLAQMRFTYLATALCDCD
jgi:ubiquinone/menaquinone biosynthesis C-methylase UbiE